MKTTTRVFTVLFHLEWNKFSRINCHSIFRMLIIQTLEQNWEIFGHLSCKYTCQHIKESLRSWLLWKSMINNKLLRCHPSIMLTRSERVRFPCLQSSHYKKPMEGAMKRTRIWFTLKSHMQLIQCRLFRVAASSFLHIYIVKPYFNIYLPLTYQ